MWKWVGGGIRGNTIANSYKGLKEAFYGWKEKLARESTHRSFENLVGLWHLKECFLAYLFALPHLPFPIFRLTRASKRKKKMVFKKKWSLLQTVVDSFKLNPEEKSVFRICSAFAPLLLYCCLFSSLWNSRPRKTVLLHDKPSKNTLLLSSFIFVYHAISLLLHVIGS